MSLLDDLRAIEGFPPSHAPTAPEVLELVGKLASYVEHGAELLDAAEQDRKAREDGEPARHVNDLLAPPEDEPQAADQAAEIAELRQQVQTLLANQQRTVPAEPDRPPVAEPEPAVGPGPAAGLGPIVPPPGAGSSTSESA